MPQVFLDVAEPHAGQQYILDNAGQYNCVRPGRRFGKTECGVEIAMQCVLSGGKCGWFAPEAKYHEEGWSRFLARAAPILAGTNKKTGVWIATTKTKGEFHCWSLHNNPDAGRSKDYDVVIVDEAGLVKGLAAWFTNAAMPTLLDRNGRAFLFGTPKLSGKDFNEFFRRGEKAGGRGEWRSFKGKTEDNYTIPNVKPWLAKRKAEAIAEGRLWQYLQEYEGEPSDSVNGFFPLSLRQAHADRHACSPVTTGSVVVPLRWQSEVDAILTNGLIDRISYLDNENGPLKLWVETHRGQPSKQCPSACLFADIGCGVGSSNSVISLGNSDTGEKFGEYASTGESPEDLARVAMMLGWWIGGREHPARIGFEANGPGEQFVKILRKCNYPNIQTRERPASKTKGGHTDDYGWWNAPGPKYSLLSEYKSALKNSEFINPSQVAIDEGECYYVDRQNRVFHEADLAEPDPETGAALPHGDRVIADAGLHQVMQSNPVSVEEQPPPPVGSFAWRQLQSELEEAEAER